MGSSTDAPSGLLGHAGDPMRTFHLLVANTLVANVTNNFLWFALTFWVYLETRSVLATAMIGGGYMLLVAVSGMFFGTFVDRHLRRTSMLLSSVISLVTFALAGVVYAIAPGAGLRDLTASTTSSPGGGQPVPRAAASSIPARSSFFWAASL